MLTAEVIDLYTKLEAEGIQVWLDGGWAVDALLGEQTRPHQDLDIAIQHKDLAKFKEYLLGQGFKEVTRDEDKMWDLVLQHQDGREIEAHVFSYDGAGVVISEDDWNGYTNDSLGGTGTIEGRTVRCVSLNQLVKTHDASKRTLKETDHHDMAALSKKFGVTF